MSARSDQLQTVSLLQQASEWIVLIREAGKSEVVRSFVTRAFAHSYAEGQRLRLNLPAISLTPDDGRRFEMKNRDAS